jgi:hypothetical protein
LYGNNCYRPDEVALTDEEYELFGWKESDEQVCISVWWFCERL